jgi:hypothetical protein
VVQKAWKSGVLPLPWTISTDILAIPLIKDYTRFVAILRQSTFLEDNKLYPVHIQAISHALDATNEYQLKLVAKIEALEQSIPPLREQRFRFLAYPSRHSYDEFHIKQGKEKEEIQVECILCTRKH